MIDSTESRGSQDPDDIETQLPWAVTPKPPVDPLTTRPVVRPDPVEHRRQHPLPPMPPVTFTAKTAPLWYEDWRGDLGTPEKWKEIIESQEHNDDAAKNFTSVLIAFFIIACILLCFVVAVIFIRSD